MIARSALPFSPGAAGSVLEREDEWQDRALCAEVDSDLFFPEQGGSVRPAKKVCRGCEVRPECLQFALDTEQEFGVWGGLSPEERNTLLYGRRQAREAAWNELRAELDERARRRHSDGTKRCSGCRKVKPLAGFSYHRGNADGLQYHCADCCALERAPLKNAA